MFPRRRVGDTRVVPASRVVGVVGVALGAFALVAIVFAMTRGGSGDAGEHSDSVEWVLDNRDDLLGKRVSVRGSISLREGPALLLGEPLMPSGSDLVVVRRSGKLPVGLRTGDLVQATGTLRAFTPAALRGDVPASSPLRSLEQDATMITAETIDRVSP
jgi:hypothetical protein